MAYFIGYVLGLVFFGGIVLFILAVIIAALGDFV